MPRRLTSQINLLKLRWVDSLAKPSSQETPCRRHRVNIIIVRHELDQRRLKSEVQVLPVQVKGGA